MDSDAPDNQPEAEQTAASLLAIENLIKSKTAQLAKLKKEGNSFKEMIDSYLANDPEYTEIEEQAKQASKAKTAKKKNLLELTEIKSTVDKYKDNKLSAKELRLSLSVNLAEFQRLSGASEIELEGGDLRQIVYTAKLVKRSQQD